MGHQHSHSPSAFALLDPSLTLLHAGTPVSRPISGTHTLPPSHIPPTSEHHIASSLFARFPLLTCIIHSHAAPFLAISAPGLPPLRAMSPAAAFLGDSVPVFDVARRYPADGMVGGTVGRAVGWMGGLIGGGGEKAGTGAGSEVPIRNLLVTTKPLGDALAEAFLLPASASGAAMEMARALTISSTSLLTSSSDNNKEKDADKQMQSHLPDHAALLLRSHGLTLWATSLEQAVFRAVYALENAQVQLQAMQAQLSARTVATGQVEVRDGKGGKAEVGFEGFDGGLKGAELREAAGSVGLGEEVKKAWRSWEREVRVSGKYGA